MSANTHLSRSRSPFVWSALVLCLAASHCLALDPEKTISQYNCRTWTRQNGLPVDGINAIAQTADGYLWLGTANGLFSFDGIEFKSQPLSRLQSQIVTSLSSSRAGGLWMGMEFGAFAYCDGQNITYQGREAWGGVNLNVNSILETRDHAVWLGAVTGVARLSKEHLFQTFTNFDTADTTALLQDSKGRVWIGTAHRGLFWWENGVLARFPDHAVDNQEIRALAEDKDGQIWIGTDWGPLCYDSNFLRKDFPFPWYPIRALLVDREGTLWMGTTGGGLIKYQNGTTTSFRKQDGLAGDFVGALAEDQEGNLWVGTRDGISQLTDVKIPTFTKTEGVPDAVIADVSASRNGGLWLATGNGFTYFDGKGNSSTTLLGLTNEYVNRIFEAKNGDICLINGYKDIEFFRGTNVLARYTNNDWPTAFGEDDTGVVVSVGKKLFRVGTNYFSPFPFAGGQDPELGWIFNIAPGRDGSLWLATDAGICRIKDGVFKLWSATNGLPEGHAVWVCEDNQGVVWAGLDKGIARIKDGKVTIVNRDHGLFDNIIYSAIPDNHGRLWVDSSRGFFSLDTRNFDDYASGKTNQVTCTDFTGLDGVKSSDRFQQQYAGGKTLDGRIWFPTAQGVVMIDPDRIKTQSIAPRIYIQSTRADGTELKPGEKTARPGKGDLEFQYAGLSYIAPQRIHYRYLLQGYNKEWVDAGTRRAAFYTNIKPGQYRFLVQACNEDGVWSTASAFVDVELLPHFYQTLWFRLATIALLVAGLASLVWLRLRQANRRQETLKRMNAELDRRVVERTAELAESLSVLNATLGSTADGILVVNREGKKIFQNQRTTDLWKIPPHIAEGSDDAAQVRHVMNMTVEPERFREKVEYFYAHPDESGQNEIKLKDGTILERITAPVLGKDGKNYGRIWTFRDVTKSRKYEADLRESQALYHSLVDQMPAAVFRKDAAGRYVFVNSAFCRIMEMSPDQILGKTSSELVADMKVTQANTRLVSDRLGTQGISHHESIMRTGRQIMVEDEYQGSDGRRGLYHTVKSAVFGAEGQIVGSQGMLFDITDREQAKAELSHERDLLRSLLDSSPDEIYFKDVQSRFLKSSKSQAEKFGMKDADEVVGKTDFDMFAEEHARPAFEDEQEIIRTGVPLIGKVEKEVRKDGRVTWVITNKMPLRNKDGEIIGTFGISKDITVIKQAEFELAHQRDLLGTLMNHSPDSIFFKDLQSRFVKLSRSEANNLLQVSLSHYRASHPADGKDSLPPHLVSVEEFEKYVIGKSDADIYGPERAGEFSHDEQKIMRTGQPVVGKIEKTIHPDGSTVWYTTTKVPWRNSDGEIIGTFGTSRDVSGLKNAEAKIEETHKQLLETSRLAGMAEIATNVLHNIGNVLNSVNVSASLVVDNMKKCKIASLAKVAAMLREHEHDLGAFITRDAKGKQLPAYLGQLSEQLLADQKAAILELDLLVKNIEHIKEVVTMQQSYARVSGVKEVINIRELVEDGLRMNAGALDRHRVEVIREYQDVPLINVDKHRVLQILLNLIRNAKYACDESGRVDRRLTMRVTNGEGRIKISVSDNGIGIPPENLTRIFSHGFTTRKDGHGFGLHSGALAAKEMGGSLIVRSEGPGRGAMFTLELPTGTSGARPTPSTGDLP